VAAFGGVALLGAVPSAHADGPIAIDFDYISRTAGAEQAWRIEVTARTSDGRAPALTLARCVPDEPSCTPLDVTASNGELTYDLPIRERLEATYEVTAVDGTDTAIARSAPYRGQIVAVRPAWIRFDAPQPRVGATATPGPATWFGGGIGQIAGGAQVQACSDPVGGGCRVLSQRLGILHESSLVEPVTLTASEAGAYLRVVERVGGLALLRQPPVVLPPQRLEPWVGDPWTAVSPAFGPVGPASTAPDPGPDARRPDRSSPVAPSVRIARSLRRGARRTVAVVRCPRACRVAATLRRGRRKVVLRTGTRRAGTVRVNVAPTVLRRLGGSRLRVTIAVDGRVRARGTVALAPRSRH